MNLELEMHELSQSELDQIAGGNPVVVAIAVVAARKYGPYAVAGAVGAVAGWFSEE